MITDLFISSHYTLDVNLQSTKSMWLIIIINNNNNYYTITSTIGTKNDNNRNKNNVELHNNDDGGVVIMILITNLTELQLVMMKRIIQYDQISREIVNQWNMFINICVSNESWSQIRIWVLIAQYWFITRYFHRTH